MISSPNSVTSHPTTRSFSALFTEFLPPAIHRIYRELDWLLFLVLFGSLLSACPKPSNQGTTARPAGPVKLRLTFTKSWTQTYQAKILFRARMDQLGTKESSKHTFLATFSITRKVTSLDKRRACFDDRFSEASVRIDNLPPRVTEAVAKEFDSAGVLWCLDKSGHLSLFSTRGLGPALEGLKLRAVLSRIYQIAAAASIPGRKLGDEWKQTAKNRQTIAGKKVQTDIETDYAVMQSQDCRASSLGTDDKTRPSRSKKDSGQASRSPGSSSRAKTGCLEVLVKERGVIPDFELTKGQKSFKMGGVIKGRASILVDSNKSSWRQWVIRRVVGIAATTKIRGASTDFGMRTDVLFLLTPKGR